MYSFFFDNVKNFLLVLKAFLPLDLFFWISTCIEIALEIGGEFFRKFIVAFSDRFFVFILVNFLILVIFALSNQIEPTKPDPYDRRISTLDYSPAPEEESEPTDLDKQIVCLDNAVSVPSVNQYTVIHETQPSYNPTVYSPVQGNTVSAITEVKNRKSTTHSESLEQCGNWREETMLKYTPTVYRPVRSNTVSATAEVERNRKSITHSDCRNWRNKMKGDYNQTVYSPFQGNTVSTITEVKRYRKRTSTHSDCGNWRDETQCSYNKPTVYPARGDTVSTVTELTRYRSEYSTHSESFEQCGNRRIFQQSETRVRRDMVAREARRRWSAMDDLSDEEFRLKVDTFISTKRKTLFLEDMAFQTQETEENYIAMSLFRS